MNPEEVLAEIVEKLSLSQNQQVQVSYLIKNIFKQQSEYLKQTQGSDKLTNKESMEHLKAVIDNAVELVGRLLNDDQLAELTELLYWNIDRPANQSLIADLRKIRLYRPPHNLTATVMSCINEKKHQKSNE